MLRISATPGSLTPRHIIIIIIIIMTGMAW